MEPGDQLGRYKLERSLGAGAFATVWLAKRDDGLAVAAKILRSEHLDRAPSATGPSAVERFIEEAHLHARLDIDGLVDMLDVVDERGLGRVALILEYLAGADLGKQAEFLTLEELLDVCAQAADILAELHEAGVVHRDVKPSNIFLLPRAPDEAPRVKLLDLGVAKDLFLPSLRRRTALGVAVGTLQIMPPEGIRRLEGEDVPITHAEDQWGLATSLYSCLSGRLPFTGDDFLTAVKTRPMAPLEMRPELGFARVPSAIESTLARCFNKDPADRFPSMRALGASLRTALGAVRRMRAARGEAGLNATVDVSEMETERVDDVPKALGSGSVPAASTRSERPPSFEAPFTTLPPTVDVPPPRSTPASRARISWIGIAIAVLGVLAVVIWMAAS